MGISTIQQLKEGLVLLNSTKRLISLCIILSLVVSVFNGCGFSLKGESTTENRGTEISMSESITKKILDAFDEKDYVSIVEYAPEYIYNMTTEEKEAEYRDGGFSQEAEFSYHHDSIVWMYLLSLLEDLDELSSKSKFVEEFLKCEDCFIQASPDSYFQMTYILNSFIESPEELEILAETLSMVLLKSDNILDIIPAISACYGNIDMLDENQYYVTMSIVLNDYRRIVSEDEKVEKAQQIDEYYSCVSSDSDGKTALTKDEMLSLIDRIDDSYDVEKIMNEVGENLICRKDVCLIYSENNEYRIVFYGFPVKLVGVENILTGEVVSYKLLQEVSDGISIPLNETIAL